MQSTDNLIWIDLEMTGLNVDSCAIIEIATIITDKDLNIIAEAEPIAIHQSDEILNTMNEWCIKVHGETGLTQRVRDSKTSLKEAERKTLDFIKQYVPYQSSPLCGNSIWQDRRFLAKYMPDIDDYCHYRMLDVTSLKLLNEYWGDGESFYKKSTHQALDDIRESISELKFYRQKLLYK
ncbi:oligoribonuclease [Francisella salimarina]|uniref:Oligoribonuclease n=1 Tax=Francisella salimarina TaxID=2599927 RepID=A0AAJ4NNZ2_9GAMM|nr:oligoribonuclease [Francisella salimarina]QWU99354.1 oligoribonuclease [Francisella salimarina]